MTGKRRVFLQEKLLIFGIWKKIWLMQYFSNLIFILLSFKECFVTFEFDINMSIMYVTRALLYLY